MKLVIDISEEDEKALSTMGLWRVTKETQDRISMAIAHGVPVDTCGDCISRQAAIDAFERFIHELGIEDEPYNYGEMALSVQNVPSVEPERKTGKWIRAIDPDVNAWTGGHTCSECGRACVQMSMNYCANCGAPMEVDDTINLKIGDFPHEKSDNNR